MNSLFKKISYICHISYFATKVTEISVISKFERKCINRDGNTSEDAALVIEGGRESEVKL